MTYDNPWLYNDASFDSENIQDYFGFCYLLTNIKTGRKYVGRKYFLSNRKNPKKKRSRIIKESDWKEYYGSCDEIIKDIEKGETFKREILSLHKTKGLVNFNEVRWQFHYEVLTKINEKGEPLFYNSQILNRYYAKNIRGKD